MSDRRWRHPRWVRCVAAAFIGAIIGTLYFAGSLLDALRVAWLAAREGCMPLMAERPGRAVRPFWCVTEDDA